MLGFGSVFAGIVSTGVSGGGITADGGGATATARVVSPGFAARRLSVQNATVITAVQAVTTLLNADYVRQQTDRLLIALDEDAELAIGTAKEFVETMCKTILEEKGLPVDPSWDFPKLVRGTMKELKLVPDQVASGSGDSP